MIKIESRADIERIFNPGHRKVALAIWSMLEEAYKDFIGDDNFELKDVGKLEYIENRYDDITDRENLNKPEGLLLDQYECIEYFAEEKLYAILILMNNEYGVHYLVPDDIWINPELKKNLDFRMANPWMEGASSINTNVNDYIRKLTNVSNPQKPI